MEASGGKTAVEEANVNLCGICSKCVNSIRCTTCQKLVHVRCARVEKVTNRMTERFMSKKNGGTSDGSCKVEEQETIYMAYVKEEHNFCYFGNMIKSGVSCEIEVARRCKNDWMKFNELALVLCGRRFTKEIKGKIYKTCVRAATVQKIGM